MLDTAVKNAEKFLGKLCGGGDPPGILRDLVCHFPNDVRIMKMENSRVVLRAVTIEKILHGTVLGDHPQEGPWLILSGIVFLQNAGRDQKALALRKGYAIKNTLAGQYVMDDILLPYGRAVARDAGISGISDGIDLRNRYAVGGYPFVSLQFPHLALL